MNKQETIRLVSTALCKHYSVGSVRPRSPQRERRQSTGSLRALPSPSDTLDSWTSSVNNHEVHHLPRMGFGPLRRSRGAKGDRCQQPVRLSAPPQDPDLIRGEPLLLAVQCVHSNGHGLRWRQRRDAARPSRDSGLHVRRPDVRPRSQGPRTTHAPSARTIKLYRPRRQRSGC
ncbi:hypothetical protein V5799_024159 [Amblyomma americanum]|uniref:Uncharacterized protein n=1 Tax=Amblyomma americanum TaxID=6943 RepID=A0AAQ4ED78_AMBAM